MKAVFLGVIASLMKESVAESLGIDPPPPAKGPPIDKKFFYTELEQDGYQLYTTVGIGQPEQKMRMMPTSQEMTFAVMTTICENNDKGLSKPCLV